MSGLSPTHFPCDPNERKNRSGAHHKRRIRLESTLIGVIVVMQRKKNLPLVQLIWFIVTVALLCSLLHGMVTCFFDQFGNCPGIEAGCCVSSDNCPVPTKECVCTFAGQFKDSCWDPAGHWDCCCVEEYNCHVDGQLCIAHYRTWLHGGRC